VTTIEGLPPTFTAETNKDATFEFYVYVDDDLQEQSSPSSGREATFTPNASFGVGTYSVKVVATDEDDVGEKDEKTCSWTVVEPLTVTMPCPDTTISAPFYRYPAETNQDAIITFYLDGNEVYDIRDDDRYQPRRSASYPLPRRLAAGLHSFKVIAENDMGVGITDCGQFTVECHEQDDNSPFASFEVCEYRCCSSGEWKEAFCTQNVFINLARNGTLDEWADQLEHFEWREREGGIIYPFIESSAPSGKDLYFVSIESAEYGGHAVLGEFLGGDIKTWENWKFIQYGDLNIQKGNWQIPHGSKGMSTTVVISQITSVYIHNNHEIKKSEDIIVRFKIDEFGTPTIW
jgi:hypothetical protein